MVFNILSPTCFVRIVDKKLKGVLLLNSYLIGRDGKKERILVKADIKLVFDDKARVVQQEYGTESTAGLGITTHLDRNIVIICHTIYCY